METTTATQPAFQKDTCVGSLVRTCLPLTLLTYRALVSAQPVREPRPRPPRPVPQANWSDIATGRVTRAIRTPVRPPTIMQNEPARRLRLSLEPRLRRTSRHHSRLPLAPCTPPRPAHHALNRGGIPHRRTASHEIGGVGLAANLTNTPPAYTRAPLWPERTGMRRHSLQATFS